MEKCQNLTELYKLELIKQLELLTLNGDAYTMGQIQIVVETTLKHLDAFTDGQMLELIITLRRINTKSKTI